MKDEIKSTGAVALVTGGFVAAFCVAACCAIPILLAGIGVGSAWLGPVVSVSQPYARLLSIFAGLALVASVVIVWRAPKNCQPGAVCGRTWFRWTVTVAAVIGAVLLVLGHVYA